MLKRNSILTGLLSVISSTAFCATGQLNLEINDDAFSIGLEQYRSSGTVFSGNYGYEKDVGSLFDLGVRASNHTNRHDYSLGAKYVFFDPKNLDNSHALALGGDYTLSFTPQMKATVSAYASPSVFTSGELQRFYEFDCHVSFVLMPNANVSLGYKLTRFNYDDIGNVDFDEGLYLGVQFKL